MTDTAGIPLLHSADGPIPGSRLDYALRYAARGFYVFPLHWIVQTADSTRQCSCGDTDCRSPGKHPLTNLVPHGVKDASTDAALLQAWFSAAPEANIGMALGQRSGCFAVDIDPRNGGADTWDALQRQHGKMPDTAMAMTGGGGNHYLFRFDGRHLPGKLGQGVDIKGEGGYIVVEPSMHISGVAYCWEGSCDPLEGHQIAPGPAWIGSSAVPAATAPVIAAVGLIPPARVLELRSALVYIDADDRDSWIWVGIALKSTAAPNAFAIWTEWSQLSDKFDPAVQRKTWNGLQPSGGIHLESIFARAADRGWVNPASKQAQQFNAATEKLLAEANGGGATVEVVVPAPLAHDPIPIPILDTAARWIESQHPVTHPEITTAAVLALAAAASSRIYWSAEGHPSHLYLGILSDTVEYTRYAGEALAQIMSAAGCRRMLRSTRLSAPASIFSALIKTPSMLLISTEWGALAAQARRQPSGVLDQALQVVRDIYRRPMQPLDSHADAGLKNGGDDQAMIYWPSLTVLASVSTDQLGTLLRKSELGSGNLSQFMVVHAAADALQERRVLRQEAPPQWLLDAWLQVRRLSRVAPGDFSVQELFGLSCTPPQIHVTLGCSVDTHLNELNALSRELRLRPLVLGAKQQVMRLATALAPWANPAAPVITDAIMGWATRYVVRHTNAWIERFRTLSSDEGRVSLMQQVLDLVEAAGHAGLSRRDLAAHCWPYRALSKDKREELVAQLIADEAVVEVRADSGRKQVLVSHRHVKQEPK